jgi:hypothetical protein
MFNIYEKRPDGTRIWYDNATELSRAQGDCRRLGRILQTNPASSGCVAIVVNGNWGAIVYEAPLVVMEDLLKPPKETIGLRGMADLIAMVQTKAEKRGLVVETRPAPDGSLSETTRHDQAGALAVLAKGRANQET